MKIVFACFLLVLIIVACGDNTYQHEGKYKTSFKKGRNAGHRLGSDVIKSYPDNTLEVLEAFISINGQGHETFKYFEFDVNSTSDNRLVVYHDKEFKKKEFKGRAFYKTKIKDMTFSKVRSIRIQGKYQIPTLQEVMNVLADLDSRVIVEVKLLHNDTSRQRLIDIVDSYRGKNLKISYLAFQKAFKKSFPNKKAWCPKLKLIHKAGKAKNKNNNYCK